MRRLLPIGVMLLSAAGMLGAAALAETKVEVKDLHLCCPACVKGVEKAIKGVEGVKGATDREAGTVTLTATDDAAAQKAIDALAAAGFHGSLETKAVKFPTDSGVTPGKVTSLTLTGVHNCCRSCTKGIKDAVKEVKGVSGDTAKPKSDSFEVTGDFDPIALVGALHKAGFHVKIKK